MKYRNQSFTASVCICFAVVTQRIFDSLFQVWTEGDSDTIFREVVIDPKGVYLKRIVVWFWVLILGFLFSL